MPPKPIIASDGRRAAAIAAAMVMLLLASLGGAYAFTHVKSAVPEAVKTPINLDALSLEVPGRWSEKASTLRLPGVAKFQRLNDQRGQELLVAALAPSRTPAADANERLIVAYEAATKVLDPRLSNPALVKPVQLDDIRGLAVQTTLPGAGSLRLHQAFVFTDDDRRFWVLYLVSPLVSRTRGERPHTDEDGFFWRLVATAKIATVAATRPDDD